MKKEIIHEIEIPETVNVEIDGSLLKINGPEGEISREFKTNKLIFEKKDNKIIIGNKKATKNEKKMINTIKSHIDNMIEGVQKKFEYKLKICYNHFPFTVEIKGNEGLIKNFLGEKIPRKVKIPTGAEVNIEKDIIKIKSYNKELAGQTAANFETATRIRLRDRRVFQDGIFIIEKNGRQIA
jgi:large subunit ribosomal protein L6